LTHLRDEFEQLRAQLVSRVPCVSLMEALAAVRNEEQRLQNAGLLQSLSSSILAARSSSSSAVAPPPKAPLPAAPSSKVGGDGRPHCDYCGKKTHVEAYCFKKKKAQSRRGGSGRASQGTGSAGGSDTGGSQRSLLVLRHRRCSCCFVALLPLRLQELLVLLLSPLHSQMLLLLLSLLLILFHEF